MSVPVLLAGCCKRASAWFVPKRQEIVDVIHSQRGTNNNNTNNSTNNHTPNKNSDLSSSLSCCCCSNVLIVWIRKLMLLFLLLFVCFVNIYNMLLFVPLFMFHFMWQSITIWWGLREWWWWWYHRIWSAKKTKITATTITTTVTLTDTSPTDTSLASMIFWVLSNFIIHPSILHFYLKSH